MTTEPPTYNGDAPPPPAQRPRKPSAYEPANDPIDRFVRSGGRVFFSNASKRWVARHKGRQAIGTSAQDAVNKILSN